MKEIVLTNIPISQSQDEGEVDGWDTIDFGDDGNKNVADPGPENLHFTEQPMKINSEAQNVVAGDHESGAQLGEENTTSIGNSRKEKTSSKKE